MENKLPQNIQETFLNNARRDKAPITVYLLSGVKLTGRIRSFDKYSVVLETGANQEQLIFKHAISTVVTSRSAQSHHSGEHAAPQAASSIATSATVASHASSVPHVPEPATANKSES
jgi:host factor-I protein